MKLFFTSFVMAVVASFSLHAQNVGVGTDSPVEFFSVGASSQFRVNASGDLVRINNVQYSFPASNSSGTLVNNGSGTLSWTNAPVLAVTNFTGTLPALNGSNLTNLNAANLASGTVPTARLGSGTANSTTFLRGDGSWQTPAGGSVTVYRQSFNQTLNFVTSGFITANYTVNGAQVGDGVAISISGLPTTDAPTSRIHSIGWVSSSNTVTVNFSSHTATQNVGSVTVVVTVIR